MHTYPLPHNSSSSAHPRHKEAWQYLKTILIFTLTILCIAGAGVLLYTVPGMISEPREIVIDPDAPPSTIMDVDGKPATITYNHTSTGKAIILHEQQWTCVLELPFVGEEDALVAQIRDIRQRGYGPGCVPGG